MPIDQGSEFYVGWGTLALINGNLAQLKGRRGLAWFVASLVAGPIVTAVLSFVRPAAPPAPLR